MATALQVPTIFTAIDKVTAPVNKMQKSLGVFSKKSLEGINRVNSSIDRTVGKLGLLGKGLGLVAAGVVTNDIIQSNIKYEKSIASLKAITGVTDKQLQVYQSTINKTARDTKVFAGDIAKAFEIVGSAKPELLKSATGLDQVVRAGLQLSKAGGLVPEDAIRSTTDTLNQFDFAANQSSRVINVLAAGSKEGAAPIGLISESLKKFGTVAKSGNISLESSVALIEQLAAKSITGAEAGTSLRAVLTKISTAKALPKDALDQLKKFGVNIDLVSDKSKPFNARLKEFAKIANDDVAITKVFELEQKVAGQILLQNVGKIEKLTKKITGTNIVTEQAAINSNTLSARLDHLKAAWQNTLTATDSNNAAMSIANSILSFTAENMGVLVGVMFPVVAIFLAFQGVVYALNTISAIHNALITLKAFAYKALGINTNLAVGAQLRFLIGMTLGIIKAKIFAAAQWIMNASVSGYSLVTGIATAAQWALNAAMAANPIGFVITLIVGLISIIILAIKKYDEWGAGMLALLGPIGWIINLVQSFRRNWDMIKKSFKEGGILGGLKAIGKTLLDVVLYPLQQILEVMSNIPLIGDTIGKGAEKIKEFREGLGVVTENETSTLEPDDSGRLQTLSSPDILASTSPSDLQKLLGSGQGQNGTLDINIQDDTENLPLAINFAGDIGITTNSTIGSN